MKNNLKCNIKRQIMHKGLHKCRSDMRLLSSLRFHSVKHRGDVASNAGPCLMCFHCSFLVPQCLHTVTVLSTNLFPSSLYLTGKPKCSHTGDLNDVGRSSSSIPPLAMTTLCVDWTCALFFFHKSITIDHVCAEPKILITDQWWSVAPLI